MQVSMSRHITRKKRRKKKKRAFLRRDHELSPAKSVAASNREGAFLITFLENSASRLARGRSCEAIGRGSSANWRTRGGGLNGSTRNERTVVSFDVAFRRKRRGKYLGAAMRITKPCHGPRNPLAVVPSLTVTSTSRKIQYNTSVETALNAIERRGERAEKTVSVEAAMTMTTTTTTNDGKRHSHACGGIPDVCRAAVTAKDRGTITVSPAES